MSHVWFVDWLEGIVPWVSILSKGGRVLTVIFL